MTDCQTAFGRTSRQLQVRVTVDSAAARDWVATIAHSQAIGIDLRITSVLDDNLLAAAQALVFTGRQV